MRCAECGLYECCMRTPLGGCTSGEKIDGSVEVYTTPNTGNGPWNKGYQPSGIQDPIRAAAFELVESVEKYIRQEELRSQLLIKKENLKKLL